MVLTAVLFSAAAAAEEADKRLYVAPLLSYTAVDKDRLLEDGIGGHLSLGRRFASGLNLELTGFYSTADFDTVPATKGTVDLYGFGIGAQVFALQNYPEIYGLLALHQGFADAGKGVGANSTVFDSGVGYLFPLPLESIGLAEGGALRTELRYRYDEGGKTDSYEGVFAVGLQIPLGNLPPDLPPPVEEEAPVAVVAVADADGDGITDDLDQCPETPPGAIVDEKGCELDEDGDGIVDRLDTCAGTAPGTQVNEQGCGVDADGDGVNDELDKCPETPAGTPVSEEGCALDTDGDGIPDGQDKCPDTPAGTKVSAEGCADVCREPAPGEPITLEGCASGDAIVLRGVNFDFNKATLTANAKVILDGVADALIAAPGISVEVGGHTDAKGSDSYNLKLSDKRSISVYDYLVSRGVDAKRVTYKGYGETVPVATNDTEEGRELNRRVELKVLSQQ